MRVPAGLGHVGRPPAMKVAGAPTPGLRAHCMACTNGRGAGAAFFPELRLRGAARRRNRWPIPVLGALECGSTLAGVVGVHCAGHFPPDSRKPETMNLMGAKVAH
eukprot:CAMPEP_0168468770 /NCGR_PEP_ID=MMETSP0228-20121227/57874_1 /TAXON_ID=133427 /ORGANISM="Protoceratium reticulatum, Strain CCCM 535 (=CCMP 1889)" /LENGTH=104 /DNA_ID=CAMNT_0008484531 /DNA_START=127 /DNA_END=441 /DNA_ORIENTATION=+